MHDPTQIVLLSPSPQFCKVIAEKLSIVPEVRIRALGSFDEHTLPRIRAIQPDLAIIEAGDNEIAALAALAALQKLNAEDSLAKPSHAILISAFTPTVVPVFMKAIDQGHFDHILAPEESLDVTPDHFLNHVIDSCISVIARQRGVTLSTLMREIRNSQTVSAVQPRVRSVEPVQAIAIGSSTGGPQALLTVLPELCRQIEIPIFVVQHIQQAFTLHLAQALDAKCEYRVIEAVHNGAVAPKTVYFAPGGSHLQVIHTPAGFKTRLIDDEPELGCRPSVNVFFRSAARAYGSSLAAVILTGMGTDGTDGASMIKKHGGVVFVQDDESSVVWGMPGSAVAVNVVDEILPLTDIAGQLVRLVNRRRG